jgi:hypothetical protein
MASEQFEGRMDSTVSPKHYQFRDGIQTIDYIDAVAETLEGDEAVQFANIIKYVSRYRGKGKAIHDLNKARWYLDRLVTIVERKEMDNFGGVD